MKSGLLRPKPLSVTPHPSQPENRPFRPFWPHGPPIPRQSGRQRLKAPNSPQTRASISEAQSYPQPWSVPIRSPPHSLALPGSQSHRSNRLHSAVTRMDVSVFSPSMCRAVNWTQAPCEMPCSNAGLTTRAGQRGLRLALRQGESETATSTIQILVE